ncbi:MAG: hypothetical protein JRJ59_10005, partial [Deltaproteobacteria bacterium]|nr:hypothetical protein [Deltaproteobacteria bacterium]
MVRSMTGFGQGLGQAGESAFRVEVRSVNNRFREVTIKMPRFLMPLEDRIKGLIASEVVRGRVEVWIRLEGGAGWLRPRLNLELARGYLEALRRLQDGLGLTGEPDLALLTRFQETIDLAEEPPDLEALWPGLEAAVK